VTPDHRSPTSPAMRELADGLAFWRSHPRWPTDLHNEEYQKWARQNPHGNFTLEWWQQYQLPRLTRWIATRPYGGRDLTPRFIERASALCTTWRTACAPFLERDISTVTWTDVEAFPNEVAKIKPTRVPSSVFTSKFCHFLLPTVFPVVDNAAIGGSWQTYEHYFSFVQDEWTATDAVTQSALVATLTKATGAKEIFSGFPVINKVIELRLMGRHHPSTS
jgi:hypothetical protein